MRKYAGIVQSGRQRGSVLGFPTVNIPLTHASVSGIYAANVIVDGKAHIAAAFADVSRKILEAHILDQDLDLYGKKIAIELIKKIRESRTFENDETLRAAIADDIQKVREYFKGA